MARAATTSDVWNAIAQPHRRQILALLRDGERPVGEIAGALGLGQPQASKHLRVLREVGLVGVRAAGQERLYHLRAGALRPVHTWVREFEEQWQDRLDRLEAHLQDTAGQEEDV